MNLKIKINKMKYLYFIKIIIINFFLLGCSEQKSDDDNKKQSNISATKESLNKNAEEINECNLYASIKNIQHLENIKTDQAIKYCREYVDKFPKNKNYTFQLARAYYAKEDFNNSFSFSKKAVQLGSAEAINLLALHYHYAEGTDENFTKAIELYQKAIEMGNTDALVNLGIMYEEGNDFIKKDLDKALSLYNQASNLGNMTGTFFLAEIYAYGFENIKKDEIKAFKLMELAE